MDRRGGGGRQNPRWRSRYGSVVVSGYDIGTADGMNEKGLVANLLYLAESDYGKPNGKPVLSISLWAQYVLDQFASVDEAVTHHGKPYTVMTNSLNFDQQLALNSYWQSIGGLAFLPGTIRAADRFARASYFLAALPRQLDPACKGALPGHTFPRQAMASVLSLVRGVSVPPGLTTPGQPNLASTIWRVVSDQKRRVLLFDSVTFPGVFRVSLDQLDLRPGAPVRRLPFSFAPASGLPRSAPAATSR